MWGRLSFYTLDRLFFAIQLSIASSVRFLQRSLFPFCDGRDTSPLIVTLDSLLPIVVGDYSDRRFLSSTISAVHFPWCHCCGRGILMLRRSISRSAEDALVLHRVRIATSSSVRLVRFFHPRHAWASCRPFLCIVNGARRALLERRDLAVRQTNISLHCGCVERRRSQCVTKSYKRITVKQSPSHKGYLDHFLLTGENLCPWLIVGILKIGQRSFFTIEILNKDNSSRFHSRGSTSETQTSHFSFSCLFAWFRLQHVQGESCGREIATVTKSLYRLLFSNMKKCTDETHSIGTDLCLWSGGCSDGITAIVLGKWRKHFVKAKRMRRGVSHFSVEIDERDGSMASNLDHHFSDP